MQIKLKFSVLFVVFICLTANIQCWWDVPHMLVAQIAKNELTPSECDQLEDILSYFKEDFPASSSLITASCFADDITILGLSGFKVWHGLLKPYSPDNYLSEESISCIEALTNENNLISGITQSLKTLKNPKASKWEKCFMLRFLLHTVADIHQPLHCIQLYSRAFPYGDLAGHRFHISGMPYKNLHQLWDSAFGVGEKRINRPLSEFDIEWIEETADFIVAQFPKDSLSERHNMNFSDWGNESYLLAINVAYSEIQPGEIPSDEYLDKGEKTVLRQIALAGYRLGLILRTCLRSIGS
jgi:hypothetical protein